MEGSLSLIWSSREFRFSNVNTGNDVNLAANPLGASSGPQTHTHTLPLLSPLTPLLNHIPETQTLFQNEAGKEFSQAGIWDYLCRRLLGAILFFCGVENTHRLLFMRTIRNSLWLVTIQIGYSKHRAIGAVNSTDVLPVVSADQVIKHFRQMLQPPEPAGHRLQILVKFSFPTHKKKMKQQINQPQNYRKEEDA